MSEKLSDEYKASIKSAIEEINRNIALELEKRGDDAAGGGITLCAATKTVSPEAINYAARECGLRCIGENKVQELLAKYDELDHDLLDIQFIGRLQTNKVKYIIDKVSMIQSLDSVKLAAEINKRAAQIGRVMDVLIEINVGEEESKGGISPDRFDSFLEEISCFDNIRVRGVMTIGPICAEESELIEFFKKTFRFFIDFLQKTSHTISMPVLSMGMSDSYLSALSCGSNMIRPGTAIFGKRDYGNCR